MTELLIFGVDGLNHDLVQKLVEKGKMPNFKKLQNQENTVYGEFESYICDGYATPHTGPCLTPDVKAYTKDGIKTHDEISVGDEVLSISEKGFIEWQPVTKKMVREHKGKVYDIEHSKASATVTPDHNLAVRNDKGKIERVKASLLPSRFEIPSNGRHTEELNEVNENTAIGSDFPKTLDFAEFLGWYIADGNINGNEIRISKTVEEDKKRIKESIRLLGDYEPSERGTNICFYSKELSQDLKELVGKKSVNRRIPKKFLKRWSTKQLEKLYETLMDADGARKERNKYHTSSKKLAEDFAELCIRLGYSPSIENRGGGKQEIKGETYEVEDRYRVHIAKENNKTKIRKERHWTEKQYEGEVWDLEVKNNHTFLVERNGKFHFTGNCWTTLYTGLLPEEHGITSGGWNDGDSKFHVMNTVWDKISKETDKTMCLYGMPMTYKAKEIQGEMVSGFVSNTLKSMWDNCIYPVDEMNQKLPEDFIENTASYVAKVKSEKGAQPSADSEQFHTIIKETENNRIQTFTQIYNENSFDIAAYGTTLVDKIGHVAGINEDSKYAVESYKQLDDILGQLLETLQPAEVAIISDHGFSEYSHDLNGYVLDTTGRGMDNVFDFTPYLLDMFDLEYQSEDYGPTDQDQDLTQQEINNVKDQLESMGYF